MVKRESVSEARRLCGEGRFQESLPLFSGRQDLEKRVASHLARKPDDDVGALRRIPIEIRRLLVNSYQSYLFNLTLSRVVGDGADISAARSGDNWAERKGRRAHRGEGARSEGGCPEGRDRRRVGVRPAHPGRRIRLQGLWLEVRRRPRDHHQGGGRLPGLLLCQRSGGDEQRGWVQARALSSAGDLSSKRCERGFEVEFSLGKGEYATVLLRELLKPESPDTSGF